MTKKHRNRFLLAAAIVVTVVGIMTAPVAAAAGPVAALGLVAVTALPALLVLGVVAYVVHSNDVDRAARTQPPSSRR